LIDSQGHALTISLPPTGLYVCGDLVRLTQAFANLLNNAAKYTPKGGRIELKAVGERGEVVVTVQDNGIGIAKELQPKVFDLFVQADPSSTRTHGGLGIGLTLVKRLVALHDGRVTVESLGPGHGSEFTVRLPALADSAAKALEAPMIRTIGGGVSGARARILVVDDNKDITDSLSFVLGSLGHDVQVAGNGPLALKIAERHCPQIVLLDIGLPGMDGYEVAKRMRERPQVAQAVFVAMTGYGKEEDRLRSEQAGFIQHLVKPVDSATIVKLLSSISI
jgi:CheY-like chemotaxis protein/anti-sigma regulatory factor (Ser/Thr protein kinase)